MHDKLDGASVEDIIDVVGAAAASTTADVNEHEALVTSVLTMDSGLMHIGPPAMDMAVTEVAEERAAVLRHWIDGFVATANAIDWVQTKCPKHHGLRSVSLIEACLPGNG